MKKELQKQLIELFGEENLIKVCALKILNNKLQSGNGGLNDEEYEEHERLLEELDNVFPTF